VQRADQKPGAFDFSHWLVLPWRVRPSRRMGDRTGSLNLDVHTSGSEVWVRDESEGWLKARVLKVGSTALVVKTEKGDERTVPVSECPLQNNDARGGVEVRFSALSSSDLKIRF
jgi:hypothetical protein